jgi:hypothetical protein
VDSATIVNDLMSSCPDAAIAYHFFQYNQEETIQDVLRHIAHQLLSHPTVVSQVAIGLRKKKMPRNASLLLKDLVAVICDIALTSGRTYIVLDGLDEFPHCNKLLKHLPEFLRAKSRVIISSRELPNIQTHMKSAVLLDAYAERLDVELYVQWRLEEDSEIDEDLLNDNLKSEIISKIVGQVDGS